ncbi:hypothetical protein ACWC19_36085, partial [Streptomyces sp. 900105245]
SGPARRTGRGARRDSAPQRSNSGDVRPRPARGRRWLRLAGVHDSVLRTLQLVGLGTASPAAQACAAHSPPDTTRFQPGR